MFSSAFSLIISISLIMESTSLDELHRFTRTIRDSVHGTIRLTDEEMKIIDSQIFRRLHYVKQNGPLYFIFPSATHKRFEHSLGTLSVADSSFKSLLRNSYAALDKDAVAPLESANHGEAVALHQLEDRRLIALHRLIRISALVHDIGHGPFSHSFDGFAPSGHDTIRYFQDELSGYEDVSKEIKEAIENDDDDELDEPIEHEYMSCLLFVELYSSRDNTKSPENSVVEDEDVPRAVASILLGAPDLVDKWLQPFVPLMKDFVASAPADADRMDYLERDSRSAGVTYGLFDRERVMKSFLPYKTKDATGEEIYRLGVKDSGLRAVENFLQARFELYVQVYYHKTNRGAQLMLKEISKEAENSLLDYAEDIPSLYLSLSDDRFLRALRGKDSKYTINNQRINKIAKRILNRNVWKRIYEAKNKRTKKVIEELSDEDDVETDDVFDEPAKNIKDGASLLTREKQDLYKSRGDFRWAERSSIIKAIKENTSSINRAYYTGSNEDRGRLRELRSDARRKASEVNI